MSGTMVCHSATCVWDKSSLHRWAVTVSTACVTRFGAVADWWWFDQWQTCLLACVHASGGHFEHTLWLSICFLCIWWTLCFTPCLMYKECIIKLWNLTFSFSLGSVSTLFRWGGHFYHICMKISSCLQQCKKINNPSRFSRVMITNVLPPFYVSQCIS